MDKFKDNIIKLASKRVKELSKIVSKKEPKDMLGKEVCIYNTLELNKRIIKIFSK